MITRKPLFAFSIPALLPLVTAALFVAAAYCFRASADAVAVVTLFIAVTCVGLLLRQHPLPFFISWRVESAAAQARPSNRLDTLFVALGIALLLFLAEINGQVLQIGLFTQVHYLAQFGLLIGGIAQFVVGLCRRDWRWPALARRDALLVAGITLLAFALRIVMVDTSLHRFVDDLHFINAIPQLWNDPYLHILHPFSDLAAFTWVYPILQNFSSGILGTNLIGLRAVSAVFGALTIPALYFLARTLFHDGLLALLAALLLAVFPPHMHFSRLGINNVADPLFGTLALAFLIRGLQSRTCADFVLAGMMLGLTQYFYEGGRLLFPFLLLVAMLLYGLLLPDKRRHFKAFGGVLLVAFLIATPVYYTLAAEHDIMMPRLHNESILPQWYVSLLAYNGDGASEWLTQRFADPLLVYVARPDGSWFYGGNEALILPYIVPFFLLGVALLLWKLRSPSALLLLWILLTSLGNSFLKESDWSPRYVVVFPALALLIALGLRYALTFLSGKRGQMIGGIVVLIIVAGQVFYYFHDHLPVLNQQLAQPEEWDDALFRLTTLPAGTQAHFIMETPVRTFNTEAFLRFWRLDIPLDVKPLDELTDDYLISLRRDVNQVFFVSLSQTATLALLRKYFTLSPPEFSPYDIPLMNQLALYHASSNPP